MIEQWKPGDRVYDVALPEFVGTVSRIWESDGRVCVTVEHDAGCSSVYAPTELDWYTRPTEGARS